MNNNDVNELNQNNDETMVTVQQEMVQGIQNAVEQPMDSNTVNQPMQQQNYPQQNQKRYSYEYLFFI